MPNPRDTNAGPLDSPFPLAHFVHVLSGYSPLIRLSMLAVGVGCVIVAVAFYLFAPSQRVSSLRFRLEFEGAERGEYPNGTKFSSAEIISTPVLLNAFKQNDLDRYMTFEMFTNSVVVLESNAAQETLSRDYRARLADPKLTPIDRERIQREYESLLASLDKSEYAIHYLHQGRDTTVPPVVIEKVLQNILTQWAAFVTREQHVLQYRVSVLSPDVVSATTHEQSNPIVATEVLRSRIQRVLANIDEIRRLPSAELVRSTKEGLSLLDIQIRLNDMIRFRLEPLTHHIASAGLDDRANTIQFLETQLAYDQRQLDAQQRIAEAARDTMGMYMNGQTSEQQRLSQTLSGGSQPSNGGTETVMPQLSDSFIERLIQLTSTATDHEYRQRLADRYREASVAVVPMQQSVAYDKSMLELVRRAGGGGPNITREEVERQIGTTRKEARELVLNIHEIYKKISENLNPSTELMTVLTAPTTRVERSIGIKRLALFCVLALVLAFPIIIFICLVHNRIREEESAEETAAGEQSVQPAA